MCFHNQWADFVSVLHWRKNCSIPNRMNHSNSLLMCGFPYRARYSIKRICMNNIRFELITNLLKILHTIRIIVASQFLCHFFEHTNTILFITIFIKIKLSSCATINCNTIDFFFCPFSISCISTIDGNCMTMLQKILCKQFDALFCTALHIRIIKCIYNKYSHLNSSTSSYSFYFVIEIL